VRGVFWWHGGSPEREGWCVDHDCVFHVDDVAAEHVHHDG
jgi:hypothetical protein